MMPGTPTMGWESLPLEGQLATINYYGLNLDRAIFVVISMSKKDAPKPDLAHILMLNLFNKFIPTSLLDNAEEKEKSVSSAHVRNISLGGYPGRAYTLRAHNWSGLSNFYITGKNYYLVGALTSRKSTAPLKKFLDSFALAPPAQSPAGGAAAQPVKVEATEAAAGRREALGRPAAGQTWLVILNTYPRTEREKADRRQAAVRKLGYEVRVAESGDYPNLRKGFLVLFAGPYAKGEAERTLSRVRRIAPDAYIKSGW